MASSQRSTPLAPPGPSLGRRRGAEGDQERPTTTTPSLVRHGVLNQDPGEDLAASVLRLLSSRRRLFLTQHAVPKVIDKESPQLIRSRRLSRQVAGARVEEADELCDESIIERGYVVIVDR